jgi:osmotically-inducible protein OsmY
MTDTGTNEAEHVASAELAEKVATHVRAKTGGRVHSARVRVEGGVVTVSGAAPSFHLKQLALEAARSVLTGLSFRLNVEITVHAR